MANSSNWRIKGITVHLIILEALTVSVLVLAIITLVAGRRPHSIQTLPILTFDTSYVTSLLVSQGISNPGNVRDWYEPHYLSVCKGMWRSAGTHLKDDASTVCTVMTGGYQFSLPKLLAADAGLPVDTPLLSDWSFAVINTKAPFICLAIAIAFTGLTTIAYSVTIITTPNLTTESPLFIPRLGYLSSIPALIMFIISSAKITSTLDHVLKAKPVGEKGVAWSTGGLYALTWLATVLMCFMFTLSLVFTVKLAPPPKSPHKELGRRPSEYSNVY